MVTELNSTRPGLWVKIESFLVGNDQQATTEWLATSIYTNIPVSSIKKTGGAIRHNPEFGGAIITYFSVVFVVLSVSQLKNCA